VSKPSVKFIIKKWLRKRLNNGNKLVVSHEIETDLVEYGKEYWGCLHTPSTYSRAWRQLKASDELKEIDVFGVRRVNNKSVETTWKLQTGEVPYQSTLGF